jgi:serine/threonine protein kinase/anti-anti-sigma regulatory factor/anti-sigma regulatory factor (Ser/Thr protein kinase)
VDSSFGSDQHDSMEGVWILDQYKILKQIGEGGMGQVYLADQPSMGRRAAIKVVRAHGANEDARQRFRREARAISRLSHPNIVTVFNFGELQDGSLFLAMEMISGTRLRSLLTRGRLPSLRAINLTYQSAAALGFAHSRKIVHRDFKPENVMVSRLLGRDHIKVLDFGIARFVDEVSSISNPDILLGTPQYLSPEQCSGGSASTFSDQYALGLVFFEMLTGQHAVQADTPFEFLRQHLEQEIPRPSTIHNEPELKILDSIVKRMTAREPQERFPTMERLQEALDAVVATILERNTGPKGAGGINLSRDDLPSPAALESQIADLESISGPLCRVQLVGDAGVLPQGCREGLIRQGLCIHPGAMPIAALGQEEEPPAHLWVLATELARLREALKRLDRSKVPLGRTVVCIDSPLDTDGLTSIAELTERFILGPFPQDPFLVELVLRRLQRDDISVVDALGIGSTAREVLLDQPDQRRQLMEVILDDLKNEEVAGTTQQAAREVIEELASNAIHHARAAGGDTESRGATFRWAVTQEMVLIAMTDGSGTITANEVLEHATGAQISPREQPDRPGAGLGLRMISRAVQHLLFLIRPDVTCETVALLRRRPWRSGAMSRCLAVLRSESTQEARVGDRLWLVPVPDAHVTLLALRGEIDETADLTPVFNRAGEVVLDLSGVTTVTSMGIQQWLAAHRARDPGLELALACCSQAVVRQLGMLPLLTETARVHSITVPFICESCGSETSLVVVVEDLKELPPKGGPCSECGVALEFAEMPELYFAFMER